MFSELTEEDLKKEVDIPLGHRLLLRKNLRQTSLSQIPSNPKALEPSLSSQPICSQTFSVLQQTLPPSLPSNSEGVSPPQKKPISTSSNHSTSFTPTKMHATSSLPSLLPSISLMSSPSSRISHAPASPSPLSSSLSSSSYHPKEKHTEIVMKSRIITEISMEGLLKDKVFVDINDIANYESEKSGASMWFTVGVMTEKAYKVSSSSGSHFEHLMRH